MEDGKNWELAYLENFICDRVQVHDYPDGMDERRLKVDLLERAIEAWRIENRYSTNSVEYEEFDIPHLFVSGNALHFKYEKPGMSLKTPPIDLQPKLLIFLLLYHHHFNNVYKTIDRFIEVIWDTLHRYDFKKTKTGVTRCFTNTRFAANKLRDFGLIKFTPDEAYKRWELTLFGLAVASRVYETTRNDLWEHPITHPFKYWGLHSSIGEAIENLSGYDRFVASLTSLCRKDADIFGSFEGVLQKAYKLLQQYRNILAASKLSEATPRSYRLALQREKEELSRALVNKLEDMSDLDVFCREFSACMTINTLADGAA